MRTVDPKTAAQWLEQGATLIDIREPGEYAQCHIPWAHNLPLSVLEGGDALAHPRGRVIFHCLSGKRTSLNAERLAACVNGDAWLLDGGLDGWRGQALPVQGSAPRLEINRQVQIAAGTLVVVGAVLGATLSPWFHLLSALIGAGLVFAGVSGFCGLARLLQRMPWNRPRRG